MHIQKIVMTAHKKALIVTLKDDTLFMNPANQLENNMIPREHRKHSSGEQNKENKDKIMLEGDTAKYTYKVQRKYVLEWYSL